MASGEGSLDKLDALITEALSDWNIYTVVFGTVVLLYFAYPWLTWRDPDIHPFLLARQSIAAPIRDPGESAVYRTIEIPYGYPLRAGLAVKDPGAPKWSSGRDGDLRDIWRQAVNGPVAEDGSFKGSKSKFITVLGTQSALEHDLGDVTVEINVIGSYVQSKGCKVAAVSLSNSVELLSSIFAAAFFGYRIALIPFGLSTKNLSAALSKIKPDCFTTEAGATDLKSVLSDCKSIKNVILVTRSGSEHMDWHEDAKSVGRKFESNTWKELVAKGMGSAPKGVLPLDKETSVEPISCLSPKDGSFEIIEYSSASIVASVAALNAALPRNHRFSSTDTLLPLISLSRPYALSLTLAALFANASVALNSVAGGQVDFVQARAGAFPTIIVASPETMLEYRNNAAVIRCGTLDRLQLWYQRKSFAEGYMPSTTSTSALRLLLISRDVDNTASPKLSSSVLADLRLFLSARVGYALTASGVAGAVCQTNIFDYREMPGEASFGAPLSSIEFKLIGSDDEVGAPEPRGKIVVQGPAVNGGTRTIDAIGQVGVDNTLSLV